ncbi:MAG: NADH-quinone oxidoreductase subunit N [Chloroflexota bacterium]|nr:MAG: NADH-quinone oxidoreductase subunit N [Chloroflexota bacterium]
MDGLVLLYLSPELILIAASLLIFGLDLVWRGRGSQTLGIVALVALFLSLIVTPLIAFRADPTELLSIKWGNQIALFCKICGPTVADLSYWEPALVADAIYVSDNLTNFFRIIASITGIVVLFASFDFMRGRKFVGEFYALFLLAIAAMMMMAGSTNLLMIFLTLEFLSIVSYILTGYLRENKKSNEAAIKYFLFGAIASAIMLYGMSMFYGATGSLNLAQIGAVITADTNYEVLALFAAALMLAGIGFKIALVPFHMWAPDAYEGAPTPVTAFLSVGPKVAGFAILLRLTLQVIYVYQFDWVALYSVVAVITMTLGNVIALTQSNVKRLLAYSSIAQAGYMLIGVASISGSGQPLDGVNAVLIYIAAYLFTNLGAFLVVIAIENKTGAVDISQYGGMIKRAPALAILMTYFMLSLAGIPPTAGFLGKFFVFGSAINSGLAWLAVIGVINSVISLFYYMRVIRPMFFDPTPEGAQPISYSRWLQTGLVVTAVMTLLIMLFPTPLFNLVSYGTQIFGIAMR